MTHLVVWPHHGASKNLRRVIEVYAGQPPELLSLFRRDPDWGRSVVIRCATPACAIGARRCILLNRPELVEALCRGERLRIVKSVCDAARKGETETGSNNSDDPDSEDAAAAIRAARRKNAHRPQ